MADTMLRFENDNLSNFLTIEELKRKCPSAFKTEPTNPNVSSKYVHANTITVINDLEKLGWYPVEAKQCRSKKGSSGIRSFHMIALQNPDVKICKTVNNEQIVDCYPRIILTNSHDGMNSFKFILGLVRLICSNGLVLSNDNFLNMSIRHMSYTFENLRKIIKTTIEQVPNIVCTMNQMKNTYLDNSAKKELATAVVKIRKDIEDDEKFEIDEETILDILNPVREEDKSNDLWTIFNVCQEKMIKGGFSSVGRKNKMRKQRSITSIKKDIDYNQKLWNIAVSYLPMEMAA